MQVTGLSFSLKVRQSLDDLSSASRALVGSLFCNAHPAYLDAFRNVTPSHLPSFLLPYPDCGHRMAIANGAASGLEKAAGIVSRSIGAPYRAGSSRRAIAKRWPSISLTRLFVWYLA
jgi:hypothetical protein